MLFFVVFFIVLLVGIWMIAKVAIPAMVLVAFCVIYMGVLRRILGDYKRKSDGKWIVQSGIRALLFCPSLLIPGITRWVETKDRYHDITGALVIGGPSTDAVLMVMIGSGIFIYGVIRSIVDHVNNSKPADE